MITAPINKIIPHSVVDGKGNRTAIFFQGCNLNCKYCHNPETIGDCIKCGACVAICPKKALEFTTERIVWNKDLCIDCDKCIEFCPYSSSPKIMWLTPKEVATNVEENIPFIRGITCSGGEATLHHQFITELFILTKQMGLENLIDTNAMADFKNMPQLLEVTDGFMVDIKAYDTPTHLELTGGENTDILENVLYLAKENKLTEIRTVCLSGGRNQYIIENIAKDLKAVCDISKITYKLIKYRAFGVRKEHLNLAAPTDAEMAELKEIALNSGFKEVVVI